MTDLKDPLDTVFNIIFVSDTHLGFDLPLHPRVNKPRRGEDFFNNFAAVLQYAREKKADYLVHGGDLFYRSRIPLGMVNRVYQMLHTFAIEGIKILIVPGNHERANLPPSLFLTDSNIHIFDRARSFTFTKGRHKISFSGFPFQKGDIRTSFKSCLEATGWNYLNGMARFLCVHQIIEGARVGPNGFRFTNGPQTITRADIPENFTAVLAGHIHRAQIIHRTGIPNDHRFPIIYSGSIERTSSAERKEIKGFYDIEIRLQANGRLAYSAIDFVELSTRPMEEIFIPVNLSQGEVLAFIEEQTRELNPRSIVYFKCRSGGGVERSILPGARQLRTILPPAMIGKFTRSLFCLIKPLSFCSQYCRLSANEEKGIKMPDPVKDCIHIALISGSVRPGNNTIKAVNLMAEALRHQENVKVTIIDAMHFDLPLPGLRDKDGNAKKLRDIVAEATGVILATPEYHGGYSSVIKLMIENLGYPSVLESKPVCMIGVATGDIGAVKALESLRGICSHLGALVLPGVLSIARVHKIFDAQGKCHDELTLERIERLAGNMVTYIRDHVCPKLALEKMVRRMEKGYRQ